MTHEQYWQGDPWLVWTYTKAHELNREMRNQEMWMQGMYFYQALSTALANFGNALAGKRRARKTHEYLKEPIRIRPLTDEEKLQERIRVQEEQARKWHQAVALVQQYERQKARKKPQNEQK